MTSPVSSRTRSLLARSLPLVRQRRQLLAEQMAPHLIAIGPAGVGGSQTAAEALVQWLVDEVGHLVESGAFRTLGTPAGHRALGLGGSHHSRFGDALVPILRDLLGPTTPREVAGAWCDAFWALVRAARAGEGELVPAEPAEPAVVG